MGSKEKNKASKTHVSKEICYSRITIWVLGVLMLLMAICVVWANARISFTHSRSVNEMIELDNSIRNSIDKWLQTYQNGVKERSEVDSLSIKSLESRITQCKKEIDSHKINMEAELDNELNKITIWITFVILVFGIINIGLTIGNQVSGALEANKVKEEIDKLSVKANNEMESLRNQLHEVKTDLSMMWDINEFDIKEAIKQYLSSKGYVKLIELLEIIKEKCCRVNNAQDYDRIRLILLHTKSALFSNFEHIVLMNNGKDFYLLNNLHRLLHETAKANNTDIEFKIRELSLHIVKIISSLKQNN
jgi:hypothetical protein